MCPRSPNLSFSCLIVYFTNRLVCDLCFLRQTVMEESAPSVLNMLKAVSLKLHACFCYTLITQCLHFELGVVQWEQSLLNVGGRYCLGEKSTGARKLNNQHFNFLRLVFLKPLSHIAWFPKPCRKTLPP